MPMTRPEKDNPQISGPIFFAKEESAEKQGGTTRRQYCPTVDGIVISNRSSKGWRCCACGDIHDSCK